VRLRVFAEKQDAHVTARYLGQQLFYSMLNPRNILATLNLPPALTKGGGLNSTLMTSREALWVKE
jgi:hypothetical protein